MVMIKIFDITTEFAYIPAVGEQILIKQGSFRPMRRVTRCWLPVSVFIPQGSTNPPGDIEMALIVLGIWLVKERGRR
jgi:hypothetical protein